MESTGDNTRVPLEKGQVETLPRPSNWVMGENKSGKSNSNYYGKWIKMDCT